MISDTLTTKNYKRNLNKIWIVFSLFFKILFTISSQTNATLIVITKSTSDLNQPFKLKGEFYV